MCFPFRSLDELVKPAQRSVYNLRVCQKQHRKYKAGVGRVVFPSTETRKNRQLIDSCAQGSKHKYVRKTFYSFARPDSASLALILLETAGGIWTLAHAFCCCELPTTLILVPDTALDIEPLVTASDLLIVKRRGKAHWQFAPAFGAGTRMRIALPEASFHLKSETCSYRKKYLLSRELRASRETFVDSLCRSSVQFMESSLEGVSRSRLRQIGASLSAAIDGGVPYRVSNICGGYIPSECVLDAAQAALEVVCFAESFMDRMVSSEKPPEVDAHQVQATVATCVAEVLGTQVDAHQVQATVATCVAEVLGTRVAGDAALMAAGIDSLAVNGPAFGAGVTQATLCDAIVSPEGCSSIHLVRIVGAVASQMIVDMWIPSSLDLLAVGLPIVETTFRIKFLNSALSTIV
ncbi:hypothetical protein AURANDRAFT_67986 [Aureococcus anophagefferens]|uniref:Uncharacterized protein n=1 Tax=Aureococcus anophagefferens TaxID=44056 RepID=F0YN49_AURAN|nr:hypothetical protein AURANDRAFT_67986 [Aureococcus anophagefferens]EGB03440.1 hypothetical protein AURANDRAFT_67986 [Aureococcus anophagefferens]|eukprot:XP_009041839.1 hypothetical protein AURANDRAFT_67986 [Aureococcus anophagefferens]